jgi:hypothetical protein
MYRYAATEGNIALMNIHEMGQPGLGAVGRVGLLLRTAMGLTFIKVRLTDETQRGANP